MENIKKVACPFCKNKPTDFRGDGCCNCEHTGLVPIGENFNFKTEKEALNHNPEVGYVDLIINRRNGRDLNFSPF